MSYGEFDPKFCLSGAELFEQSLPWDAMLFGRESTKTQMFHINISVSTLACENLIQPPTACETLCHLFLAIVCSTHASKAT